MFFNLFSRQTHSLDWKLKAVRMDKDDINNYGGKVILPEFILGLLTFSEVEHPWTFQISNNQKTLTTHVGVIDFTAPFGRIMVPGWLYDQLDLVNGRQVRIQYKEVMKGKFCQLLPQKKDWLEVENAKRVLENCLVNYQVLTEGDTIDLNFEDHGIMQFTVLQVDSPDGCIYIIDTDLSVDLKPPLDIDDETEKPVKIFRYTDEVKGHEIIRTKKFGFITTDYNLESK